MVFAVLVTGKEVCDDSGRIIGAAGDRWWVMHIEPASWVEATSTHFRSYDQIPADLVTFNTRAAAEKFAKRWHGHPWWVEPSGEFEVVEVTPKYRQVLDGYSAKAPIR